MMGFWADPFGIQQRHDDRVFGPAIDWESQEVRKGLQQRLEAHLDGSDVYDPLRDPGSRKSLNRWLQHQSMSPASAWPGSVPYVSEAAHCFLRHLHRIKRALEKAESFTITEAHVPLWLAKEMVQDWVLHGRGIVDPRLFVYRRGEFRPGDKVSRISGVDIVASCGPRIKFSYKGVKVA